MALTPSELRRRKMNLLMAMSYAAFASTKASTWSPTLLFAAGEQGAWYDPSDFSTMFQDSAGTTPVTAVEQPVGLILDKSKGLALGSELVTNGGFDTDTNWTKGADWTITGGSAVKVAGASTSTVYQSVTVTAGKSYKITVVVSANNNAGVLRVDFRGTTTVSSSTFTGTGTFTTILTAATGNNEVHIVGQSVEAATIDSISVKELAGNHASQSTSASRPVLSARVNLLTQTEDFSNAVWAKDSLLAFGSGSTVNATAAPNGTVTADLITSANATAATGVSQTGLVMSAASYTWSVCFKPNGARYVQLLWSGAGSSNYANFDLVGGTVTAGIYTAATIVLEANGFYRLSITSAVTAGTYGVYAWFVDSGSTGRGGSFTGDGVKGAYVWGADLRVTNVGVGLPAYQRVAAATDYDTSGFPLYLTFDGVDDSLATASMDFSATDKMSVFAGVRKLSDAAGGNIVSLGNVTSVNGSFELRAPRAATPNYMFASRGTSFADANIASGYSAPITNVVTGIADIASDLCALRINGTVVASPTTDQGTGNYSAGVVFIGRFGGTALPFNGRLYSLIVRGAQSTDAQIASTETYVNSKTGAY